MFFEAMIVKAIARHEIVVHAYAWMTNHIHMLVEIREGDEEALAGFMRDTQAAYAQMFNRRTARRGPLFQSRYVNVPVTNDAQYLTVVRYIHRNPIVITGQQGLVSYSYSSLGSYVSNRAAPSWLTQDRTSAMIDPDRHLAAVRRITSADLESVAGQTPLVRVSSQRFFATLSEWRRNTSDGERPMRSTLDLQAELAIALRIEEIVALAAHLGVEPRTVRRRAARARIALADDASLVRLRRRMLSALLRAVTSSGELSS